MVELPLGDAFSRLDPTPGLLFPNAPSGRGVRASSPARSRY
jgi:hypothetical protein